MRGHPWPWRHPHPLPSSTGPFAVEKSVSDSQNFQSGPQHCIFAAQQGQFAVCAAQAALGSGGARCRPLVARCASHRALPCCCCSKGEEGPLPLPLPSLLPPQVLSPRAFLRAALALWPAHTLHVTQVLVAAHSRRKTRANCTATPGMSSRAAGASRAA